MSDFYIIARHAGPSGRHIPEDLFISKADTEAELARKQTAFPSGQYAIFDSGWSVTMNLDVTITNSAWTTVMMFPFPGTDNGADPVEIQAVGKVVGATDKGQLRIYDVTNSQVVSNNILWDGHTAPTIRKAAAKNLPGSEAVFEVQCRRTAGTLKVRYFEMR